MVSPGAVFEYEGQAPNPVVARCLREASPEDLPGMRVVGLMGDGTGRPSSWGVSAQGGRVVRSLNRSLYVSASSSA